MSLNKRLKYLGETMWANACRETAHACEKALKNHAHFATEDGAILNAPSALPDCDLMTPEGELCSVSDLVGGRDAALLFFRGGWCPFSTTSMRALETVRPDLAALGVSVLGITPQRHAALAGVIARNGLGFPLVTDPGQKLAEAMGVRVPIIPEMIEMYRRQGSDLAELNETGDWALPLEATFIVDRAGRIVVANAYPYPTRRMEPEELLAAAKQLADSRELI